MVKKRHVACVAAQLVVLVIGCVLGIYLLKWLGENGYIEWFLQWVKDLGYIGVLVMIGALICVHIPFSFGYSIVGMACGALFGFWFGMVVIVIGGGLGCNVGYWVTRLLLRKRVTAAVEKSRPEVIAFMQEIGVNPWKISILVRFIPIPIGFQNALLAISPVRYWIYVVSSLTGMFPEQILFVYLGTTFRQLAAIASGEKPGWGEWAILGFGAVGVLMLFVVFIYIGKRTMKTAQRLHAEAQAAEGVELSEVVEEGTIEEVSMEEGGAEDGTAGAVTAPSPQENGGEGAPEAVAPEGVTTEPDVEEGGGAVLDRIIWDPKGRSETAEPIGDYDQPAKAQEAVEVVSAAAGALGAGADAGGPPALVTVMESGAVLSSGKGAVEVPSIVAAPLHVERDSAV